MNETEASFLPITGPPNLQTGCFASLYLPIVLKASKVKQDTVFRRRRAPVDVTARRPFWEAGAGPIFYRQFAEPELFRSND